jgi:hypothetical protein
MYAIPMLYLCSFSALDCNEIWCELYAIGGHPNTKPLNFL